MKKKHQNGSGISGLLWIGWLPKKGIQIVDWEEPCMTFQHLVRWSGRYHDHFLAGKCSIVMSTTSIRGLWQRSCGNHIHHLFPFLVEPVDNVRARLKEIQNHLRLGDISIAELFAACEYSSKLQLAEKVNYKLFTQAMDYLAMGGCKIEHPLMYNPRMRDVHCALLLEEEGTAQPFYDTDGDRVSIGENSSEAECYEDYCKRIGDIALWAGSGNPEILVDWMNYSDEGMMTYPIAKEIIAMHRKKLCGSQASSQNVISLSEFIGQTIARQRPCQESHTLCLV